MHQSKTEGVMPSAGINSAIIGRIGDLISTAESLRATIESERPGALLPTFHLLRTGVAIDGMVTELSEHAAKLGNPNTGNRATA